MTEKVYLQTGNPEEVISKNAPKILPKKRGPKNKGILKKLKIEMLKKST